ncbi:5-hydroxytryptamine receptor 3A-like [Sphaeramia orbicularis]|uniref:5-hydroxytryptamine receptor 3A-like n=1 Tax=Sphaeramia orbicularis TaxID=375764 RepID=UPI00117DC085|nr:5-hydroxytryptamine receptor 3A-like [Sphaeramia orbicularis]
MMFTAVISLLFLTGGVSTERKCSYQEVLNYLNLTKSNELYFMTRPVKDYTQPTWVSLEVLLYAILDVVEKDQKFIPYVWTVTRWQNEYISWKRNDFCGIDKVSLPTEVLWKPDLIIEEMTEKDKAPVIPYLFIDSKGYVEVHEDQALVSTCRMHVYKFPFDTQSCNLTFKSAIHTAKDIRLQASDNSSEATEWSREVMRTQYEWLFINMKVTTHNITNPDQDIIIYTINMKRRSLLYVINFLLPVLFFLCLDLASFLISNNGEEKLTFKVTVLLAVTVLQLILNEILPASSDRIPLIAVYCIGMFTLMLLSLLETIVVMYLMKKDNVYRDNAADNVGCLREDARDNWNHTDNVFDRGKVYGSSIYDVSSADIPSLLDRQDASSKLTEEFRALERLSDELKKVEKTLSLLLAGHIEKKPGYWTRLAKKFNRVFFIFYVTMIAVFFSFIFSQWSNE